MVLPPNRNDTSQLRRAPALTPSLRVYAVSEEFMSSGRTKPPVRALSDNNSSSQCERGHHAHIRDCRQRAPGALRLSRLCALVRHLLACLQADAGRARLHAAAGAALDRGLYAGAVAGALRR